LCSPASQGSGNNGSPFIVKFPQGGIAANYMPVVPETPETPNIPETPEAPGITETPETPKIPVGFFFNRNLKLGDIGDDVKQLQIFLNNNGFKLASAGPGSLGNETNKFGWLTKAAVIKFQEAYANDILKPLGLRYGTGIFYSYSRNFANKMLGQ